MPSPLEDLTKIIPTLRGNGLSAQTNRSLIEHGEHATIQKPPAAPAAPVAPAGPGNVKGKASAEVMSGFRGETVEQFKARQAAQNAAILERHKRMRGTLGE
jgi:hypothetical protein